MLEVWEHSPSVIDAQGYTVACGLIDHAVELLAGHRNWLFTEDVNPSTQKVHTDGIVEKMRHSNNNALNAIEDLGVVVRESRGSQFFAHNLGSSKVCIHHKKVLTNFGKFL